jgi:hypothetical protein
VAFGPFDPTATVVDDDGHVIRYLNTPLDNEYIVDPADDCIPEGVLPPEDFEVRRAIVEMKLATEHWRGLGLLHRLMLTEKANKAKALAVRKQRELHLLIQRSPEHTAAFRRIIDSMRDDVGREVLSSYLDLAANPRFRSRS